MTAKEVLKESQVFSTLTNAELKQVESAVLEKQYEAGATIFKKGDSADEFLVLQEGKVALQMTLPKEYGQMSRNMSIDIVTRNEIVGWSAVVEPHVYSLTAICIQKVKALSINGNKLRWLMKDNPNISDGVWTGLIKVATLRLEQTRYLLLSERLLTLAPQLRLRPVTANG